MPSRQELVAHDRDVEEIATEIGADLVIFQTLPDLIKSCSQFNPSIQEYECSVFTGKYVTGGVDDRYLDHIERLRNDNAKAKKSHTAVEALEYQSDSGCSGPMSECQMSLRKTRKNMTLMRCNRRLRLIDRSGEPFSKSRTNVDANAKRRNWTP